MPTMLSIHDKPGAGWNQINTDNYFKNYFKMSDTGDVVQKEKSLQHHNSLKRITFNWWQWGILKLFEQIQMKGHFFQCVMNQYEESNATIQARHPKLFKNVTVRNWWCACCLTSLMGWRIKNGLILTIHGWSSWQSTWRKLNQATSNRSDL